MKKIRQSDVKKISIFLMCLGMTFSISYKSALAGEKVVIYDSITIEGTFRDTQRFKVSVTTKPFDGTESCSNSYFIGTDGYDPRNILKNISLSINEKVITIPEKLTCDFANIIIPGGVYLKEDGNLKSLYILGGDGVAGYRMILEIKNGSLMSRTIRNMNKFGELEDKVLIVE